MKLVDKVRKWTIIVSKSKNILLIKIEKCCYVSCAKEGIEKLILTLAFRCKGYAKKVVFSCKNFDFEQFRAIN